VFSIVALNSVFPSFLRNSPSVVFTRSRIVVFHASLSSQPYSWTASEILISIEKSLPTAAEGSFGVALITVDTPVRLSTMKASAIATIAMVTAEAATSILLFNSIDLRMHSFPIG